MQGTDRSQVFLNTSKKKVSVSIILRDVARTFMLNPGEFLFYDELLQVTDAENKRVFITPITGMLADNMDNRYSNIR